MREYSASYYLLVFQSDEGFGGPAELRRRPGAAADERVHAGI